MAAQWQGKNFKNTVYPHTFRKPNYTKTSGQIKRLIDNLNS